MAPSMKTTLAALAILTLPGCLPNPVPRTMLEPLETTEAGFPETDREVLDPDPGFEPGPEFEEVLPETGAPEVVEVLAPPEVDPGEVPPEESEALAEAPGDDPGPKTGVEVAEVPNGQETGSVEAFEETSEIDEPIARPCDGIDPVLGTCAGSKLEKCLNLGAPNELVISRQCDQALSADGIHPQTCGFDETTGKNGCLDYVPGPT